MKRMMLSGSLLLVCMAVMFYLSSGNAPQINHSDLLLWRITLYAAISGMGWHHYDRFPPYRPVIRRIALWFIVLVALNEIVPEVFR
ncbi:hypothetical protein R5D33_004085 [Salmonella enterica]|uniref:Uncharacterized protein n=1 Tax=Salmonella enterica subsp. VII serovar 40:z4,z24:[z39] TaxID=1967625 RepID=A0A731TH25_SALEE|nr:hypothetical protein [Salmonella enterica]EDO5298503.1 hypothetical protein [Salmonella enterica subsp. houtenae serovar 40:z4,z24:-]EDS6441960.1 hypothetical protein [Salmonella enterica subsp. VII str. CFSAN000550]EDU7901900.1 hypothetical protein [Salmonella enterica subsp. houtenae]QJY67103.1 hypothetical protein HPG81_11655 [Salmonella enterica subsp. VII serovar 1,40:g,z51:--]QUZ22959.1 hypothetical protein JYN32_18540 [Salmonella enterica subsp. VII str. CFSAN000554]HAE4734332.1 hyp